MGERPDVDGTWGFSDIMAPRVTLKWLNAALLLWCHFRLYQGEVLSRLNWDWATGCWMFPGDSEACLCTKRQIHQQTDTKSGWFCKTRLSQHQWFLVLRTKQAHISNNIPGSWLDKPSVYQCLSQVSSWSGSLTVSSQHVRGNMGIEDILFSFVPHDVQHLLVLNEHLHEHVSLIRCAVSVCKHVMELPHAAPPKYLLSGVWLHGRCWDYKYGSLLLPENLELPVASQNHATRGYRSPGNGSLFVLPHHSATLPDRLVNIPSVPAFFFYDTSCFGFTFAPVSGVFTSPLSNWLW